MERDVLSFTGELPDDFAICGTNGTRFVSASSESVVLLLGYTIRPAVILGYHKRITQAPRLETYGFRRGSSVNL